MWSFVLTCQIKSLIAENYKGFDSVKDRTYGLMTNVRLAWHDLNYGLSDYMDFSGFVNYMENIKCKVFFVIMHRT